MHLSVDCIIFRGNINNDSLELGEKVTPKPEPNERNTIQFQYAFAADSCYIPLVIIFHFFFHALFHFFVRSFQRQNRKL